MQRPRSPIGRGVGFRNRRVLVRIQPGAPLRLRNVRLRQPAERRGLNPRGFWFDSRGGHRARSPTGRRRLPQSEDSGGSNPPARTSSAERSRARSPTGRGAGPRCRRLQVRILPCAPLSAMTLTSDGVFGSIRTRQIGTACPTPTGCTSRSLRGRDPSRGGHCIQNSRPSANQGRRRCRCVARTRDETPSTPFPSAAMSRGS